MSPKPNYLPKPHLHIPSHKRVMASIHEFVGNPIKFTAVINRTMKQKIGMDTENLSNAFNQLDLTDI